MDSAASGDGVRSEIVIQSREGVAHVQNGETERGPSGDFKDTPALSKNAQKRLQRQQMFQERKERMREENKRKREVDEERRRKDEEAALAAMTEEERRQLEGIKAEKAAARKAAEEAKWVAWEAAAKEGPGVVIDLEFTDLMSERELSSLQQQVMFSYALNSKASKPCQLTLTGCDGVMRRNLERISGFDKWHIAAETQPLSEAFEGRLEDLVYLTADAGEELSELDSSKTYVIGGIVDHNRYKNLTLDKAGKIGIATARLPIGKHLELTTSKVLTVNHVMDIILRYLEHRDWSKAVASAIPDRKKVSREAAKEEEGGNSDTQQDGSREGKKQRIE